MLRHKGKRRTFTHNLKLASMLSFVAGIVNVTGVLSIKVLTTNVTGHFAYFAEEVSKKNYIIAFMFLLFIFSFLVGSFFSSFLIELSNKYQLQAIYTLPMVVEVFILLLISIIFKNTVSALANAQLIACSLLFAMGLQNSLVTKASQSVVRTTHLTGLFTDLGIELSQLLFYRHTKEFKKLTKSIYLKLAIIGFFFLGCTLGGLVYEKLHSYTLLIGVVCLLFALFYDTLRFKYYYLKRKVQSW